MTHLPGDIGGNGIESADKQIEAKSHQFSVVQLAAFNLGGDAKADQIVDRIGATLIYQLAQIIHDVARTFHDIFDIEAMQQHVFPFKELLHTLARQPHQIEKHHDRKAQRKFVHELAFAAILEIGDEFA